MKQVADTVQPLEGRASDYDRLLERVGGCRFVLIGEASHGTDEFYRERATLTRRLVVEHGFHAVAVEGDWPDAHRVDRYVRGLGRDRSAEESLRGFRRFPSWMWRNEVVLDFVQWLRAHNDSTGPADAKVGFYGLDLYSLFGSIGAVLAYLEKTDPEAAKRARYLYSCFDHFHDNPQSYGYAASFDMERSCEQHVVKLLERLRSREAELTLADGDDFFDAEQNARLVKNAEEYYRSMFRGRISSWNLRDQHMCETLLELASHLDEKHGDAKIVVWAHNSHLGDARATEMGDMGEWNLGQLVRERYPDDCANVGFSTYSGTVTAASDWDEPAQTKRVRPGLPGSYEALFHEAGLPRFLLHIDRARELPPEVLEPRLQRAIGVIYRPETERESHYFRARLAEQFDAMIHIDETNALEPLERSSERPEEAPETYPTGM
ncbi:MAG TPA: erythromycin esterase family protein [Usitatibacter sp.]|jgi:erythromycin esterase-like protein|nr:erythromycin esterase family protein [Usitatibacter sp.]